MAKTRNPRKPTKENHQNQNHHPQKPEKPPSWAAVRSLFTCKYTQTQLQEQKHEPPPPPPPKQRKEEQPIEGSNKKCKKMKCSGSLCSNTKVMHRPEPTQSNEDHPKKRASMGSSTSSSNNIMINDGSSRSMKAPLTELVNNGAAVVSSNSSSHSLSVFCTSPSIAGSFRGMPFRRLSGCYECRMVVDPVLGISRDPSLRAISCPQCGEIFMKPENLELHQAIRHAVSELGPEDTSKNIVEIIFQSSWLKKQSPVCKIDRILKVHNTTKTISKFEEYRDAIKAKATNLPKKHPRCIADGNELLRFHCTTFMCSLGLNGSSNLCNSIPNCSVCSIIKNGFKVAGGVTGGVAGKGILTTATSGKAHDSAGVASEEEKRAMLVCRVVAGRVKKSLEGGVEEYDSVAGAAGVYSNLDELYVLNPRAILPCFVVVYRDF
ncbi:uncharacterized protein LOC132273768 [Cornus florida]|uniref:uncharacterized protein LOC132273768 n=1 Tax=Cornus florida TaxID=4283 RepID=UPI002897DDFE|nr:uncharacterized protein LOC132273768 [Cornus florida]